MGTQVNEGFARAQQAQFVRVASGRYPMDLASPRRRVGPTRGRERQLRAVVEIGKPCVLDDTGTGNKKYVGV